MSRSPAARLPRSARIAAAVAAICVLVLGPAAAAQAHDFLIYSTPKADSTITRPLSSVSLTFNAAVLGITRNDTAVAVLGPDGRRFDTSCAHIDGDTVTAAVRLGGSGRYTVAWRVISADGHHVSDRIQFRYQRPAGTPAAAGIDPAKGCGVVADVVNTHESVVPSTLIPTLIGTGALLLLVIAVAIVVTVRVLRSRPDGPEDHM